ncbi:cell envelope-related protein transcriptional attenuator [Beutenbergia cavernae DSM 12333]|uniref:Cell envelope-related protein transcriptional attenuator n=1 Tax=Beutenbergia cavernae (strain ATCC BAA-8 / DSM 12333 / CCUG 43141 / JCM 11478 / NBRC 16432 / NCIMB 13614 / HKI 0122) TaxID=471853 RepID=C5C4G2_BEUC1|nr:cell envelope-related protein transcriptional attenuator [Beutenbergia cavernae DSM 12333]
MALAVTSFSVTFGVAAYAELQRRVDTLDIGGLVTAQTADASADGAHPEDPNAGRALDILVIGSDSRSDGAVQDEVTSELADTHLLVHVSADRSRVELVSIPRDVMVDVPACTTTGGETIPARFDQFNSAFAVGASVGGDLTSAVACDVELVQSVTGLTLDGFVVVQMGGFIEVVDALGGVDICIPAPLDVPKASLALQAGQQRLDGTQALAYARARVGVGDGSDPDRIARQQHLLAAMVEEVLSRNVLADAPALYQVVAATLGSLTTSPNLASIPEMVSLGLSLRSVGPGNVTFMTTPFEEYEAEPGRLVFTDGVEVLWESLAADVPLASPPVSPSAPPSAGEAATTPPAADDPDAATEPPPDNSAEALDAEC